MPKVTFVQPDDSRTTVEIPVGTTLMEGAVDHDVAGIIAACGGSCSCSTCHVHIDAEWTERVGGPHEAEKDVLEFAIDPDDRSRLSCQIEVADALDGLVVHVPAEQA